MLAERDLQFVTSVLSKPPDQTTEEVSSESHETKRIPDPYVYVNRNGKFETPNGTRVEDNIDTSTPVGLSEAEAFDEIQDWSSEVEEGFSVWFSPTYPGKYPVTKIIIQEAATLDAKTKIILNRAVVLEDDDDYLLKSASRLAGGKIEDKELLRGNPVFPERDVFIEWFEDLSQDVQQMQMIREGQDLTAKAETYARVDEIVKTIPVVREGALVYNAVYHQAKKADLIGQSQGSCPVALQTAFERVYDNSLVLNQQSAIPGEGEGDFVGKENKDSFPCPKCERPIPSGEGITKCPHKGCNAKKSDYNSGCD